MDGISRSAQEVDATVTPSDYIRLETLERIRHFLQRPRNSAYTDLKGMCERVSDSYRDRVVLELLQNAHDAHRRDRQDGQIRIILDSDEGPFGTLYVANGGHGFTSGNFDALCSPSRTTKVISDAIGNKGVGFLSVFQVSAHPEIYSRSSPDQPEFDGFCFSFADDPTLTRFLAAYGLAEHLSLVTAGMPRLYLTCPTERIPPRVAALALGSFVTVVRLPLRTADALEAVGNQLDQLALGPPVQLFLTRIEELLVERSGRSLVRLARETRDVVTSPDLALMRVGCEGDRYLVAQHAVPEAQVLAVIKADVAAGNLPEAWLDWKGDALISLAVAIGVPPVAGRLYNFLPMGAGTASPFFGHLDAPFYASIDRLRLQPGVSLNTLLWREARALAVRAARATRHAIAGAEARKAALDFLLWGKDDRDALLELLEQASDTPIPVLRRGAKAWARLNEARVWKGDAVLTSQLASQASDLAIVDPEIGPERLNALAAFVSGRHSTACTSQERADIVESVAQGMHRRKRPVPRWNAFYTSVSQLFRADAAVLAGRQLLLSARGDLARTIAEGDVGTGRGRRRRRLSATFLPPLRGAGPGSAVAHELPRAVSRRLEYVDSRLEIARNGTSPARRFLLASGLVRDHDSREILRLLAAAMNDPGDAKDPDGLRWDALTAMMRIVTSEDTAEAVVRELPVLVPTRSGWDRATVACFSGRWTGEGSLGLQRMLDEAAGLSSELDSQASRLLRPFADWRVKAGERESWEKFLGKAGVVDYLRPLPAFVGTAPRAVPGDLYQTLERRAGLPSDQAEAWLQRLRAQPTPPNPLTIYTVSDAYRLPGQLEYSVLAPVVGRSYAVEVIRALEARPELALMDVYRPGHPSAPNRRAWPSPATAFLAGANWLPLADGALGLAHKGWLPNPGASPPPLLPLVEHGVVSGLLRRPNALKALRDLGLNIYGDASYAWRFLAAAAEIVSTEPVPGDAERLLSACSLAWQHALLQAAPATLTLVGRQRGKIVTIELAGAGPPILVADGDDRQMVSASTRARPDSIVFEPPRSRATEIGAFLQRRAPNRVQRAATIRASYVSEGQPIAFTHEAPFVGDVLGEGLRDVLVLSLRYRNSFFRGDVETVLQRLGSVRLRWLPELGMRIGDAVEPVPLFRERAVAFISPEGPTILASSTLEGSERVLSAIAEALGTALGGGTNIGHPLLAFAAQLHPDPLACTYQKFADVLDVPLEDIRGVLGSSRAAVAAVLRTLRPFVSLYGGEPNDAAFAPGGLSTEDDVIRVLGTLEPGFPQSPADVFSLARQGDVRPVALSLRTDLARLNVVLTRLGPPYSPVDLTEQHRATLTAFLSRREAAVRESIRASHRAVFAAGGDLRDYVRARDAEGPKLPEGFGLTSIDLDQATMHEWLAAWLLGHGVATLLDPPRDRDSSEAVCEANLRSLRALAPHLRVAILSRSPETDPLRDTFATPASAEVALTGAGSKGGWCDFERLEEGAALRWIQRAGLWPVDWSATYRDLALTDTEVAAIAAQDERARVAAATRRRVIEYSGGSFTVGVDTLGALAGRISGLVATNNALLATSNRTAQGIAPVIKPRRPGQGGGNRGEPPPGSRLSDEERDVIGFFGEAIAFEWLKRRFGRNRVVDASCWKSGYRRHVADGVGDDSLGYDFAITNGKTNWYFEVKATKADEVQSRHMIELGSSEIAHAEVCRADGRSRYRILYVLNAMQPDRARMFVLPNPRSETGKKFFADPMSAGVRLLFPLDG